MSSFNKQFFGYSKEEVNALINELQLTVEKQKTLINDLQNENNTLTDENNQLKSKIEVSIKTNEEITRLALKEASELIEKAKRNANMILKESIEYVRGLSKDMEVFKKEAIDFRTNVIKMSEDMLETIDKSEIFSLIKEEEKNN